MNDKKCHFYHAETIGDGLAEVLLINPTSRPQSSDEDSSADKAIDHNDNNDGTSFRVTLEDEDSPAEWKAYFRGFTKIIKKISIIAGDANL